MRSSVRTAKNRAEYWTALALVSATAAFDAWLLLIDLGGKTGLWSFTLADVNSQDFTASLTIWNDLAFYTHAVTSIAAVGLLVRRKRILLWVYGVSVAASFLDWVLLVGNPYYDGSVVGPIALAAHSTALFLIWLLVSQRELARPGLV